MLLEINVLHNFLRKGWLSWILQRKCTCLPTSVVNNISCHDCTLRGPQCYSATVLGYKSTTLLQFSIPFKGGPSTTILTLQYSSTTTTRSQSKKAPEHSGGLEGDWNVSTYINFKTDLWKKKTGTVRRGGSYSSWQHEFAFQRNEQTYVRTSGG